MFSVGLRGDVLTSELEAPIIVPHSQQKTEQKYPFEMLFRSIQYALVDNACREFLFISKFFIFDANTSQEIFNNIFGKTLQIWMKHVDIYVSDSISVFLCIHLLQRYQLLCHKRCVTGLDKYWETLNGKPLAKIDHCLESQHRFY